MARWSLDDIPWHEFDPSKVSPALVSVTKAASMVEHNGYDYARYLREVFHDDPAFRQVIDEWAEEEVQHGKALRKWAELAEPGFDFDTSFRRFTEGYQLPQGVAQSVRGSRAGELIARCVVETGTSIYYTAIRDAAEEPALKALCAKIAADEFRHYKLFYDMLGKYLEREKIGFWKRLWIALGRVAESEDDELAYAYFAAHEPVGAPYDRRRYSNLYMMSAAKLYRRDHVERMTGMIFKAVGLSAQGWLHKLANALAWRALQWKVAKAI